jgi:hypothetical protein
MMVAHVAAALMFAPILWLALLFVLFLLRALLRKGWVAAVAWVLLFTIFFPLTPDPVGLVGALIFSSLAVFVMIRFGLLALVANFMVVSILQNSPLTTQMSSWYAGISLTGILLMSAMVFYGFHTSLGGRPAFGGPVLEE